MIKNLCANLEEKHSLSIKERYPEVNSFVRFYPKYLHSLKTQE